MLYQLSYSRFDRKLEKVRGVRQLVLLWSEGKAAI
jgi:hypothetical protein